MATWHLGFVKRCVKYMEICWVTFGDGKVYLKHNSRLRYNDELPATKLVALYTSKTCGFVFHCTYYNFTVTTILERIRRRENSASFKVMPIC
jgi:hypothetical protein